MSIDEAVAEFDPGNPLMIFTGALTGSRSPYSGRTGVCALSPRAAPTVGSRVRTSVVTLGLCSSARATMA